jgi:uncharacterized phage protein (TIGR02218 family)
MKSITPSLLTHIQSRSTNLRTLFKVTRTDGQIFGFTDHDQSISYNGLTYEASAGYTRTAIATNSILSVDNLDLESGFDSESITEEDLHAGTWDFAFVQMMTISWINSTWGVIKERDGWLGQVSEYRHKFVTELRGLTQALQQDIGRIFQAADDADLGDVKNGLSIATFTTAGAVTTAINRRALSDSNRVEVDNWFQFGKLTFLTGLNAGLSRDVKLYTLTTGTLEFQTPFPFTIEVGDTYEVTVGYDKSIEQALTKFANVVNFRGFPDLVGQDHLMSGGI